MAHLHYDRSGNMDEPPAFQTRLGRWQAKTLRSGWAVGSEGWKCRSPSRMRSLRCGDLSARPRQVVEEDAFLLLQNLAVVAQQSSPRRAFRGMRGSPIASANGAPWRNIAAA